MKIQGFCPMGCGETLCADQLGKIFCTSPHCLRIHAVSELLTDSETQHIVQFDEVNFTIRHPQRERLDDALMHCELHEYLRCSAGPVVPLGRYRAWPCREGWSWERLGEGR